MEWTWRDRARRLVTTLRPLIHRLMPRICRSDLASAAPLVCGSSSSGGCNFCFWHRQELFSFSIAFLGRLETHAEHTTKWPSEDLVGRHRRPLKRCCHRFPGLWRVLLSFKCFCSLRVYLLRLPEPTQFFIGDDEAEAHFGSLHFGKLWIGFFWSSGSRQFHGLQFWKQPTRKQ